MEAPVLVFIGFMGAGKTSAARAAAGLIGVRAVDADHELEHRLGTTIEEHFATHGEAAFRALEEEVVCELLEQPPAPVLSLGGGAVTSARVRELLRRHTVALLDVDVETAWRRAGGRRRPLAQDRARFEALHAERGPLYDAVADAVLTDSSRDEVRRAVPALRALSRAPAGTRLLWASAASGSYPVHVGEGLLGSDFWPVPGRRFLVTDEHVGPLYADAPAVRGRPAHPARRGAQDAGDGRAPAARARGRRHGPRRPSGGARRRRGGGRRRLLRRPLPARRAGRPGADHARRPGRLRVRRQDRASTSPRARTTPARTTSRPPCSSTRRRWPRCRRPSWRRAGPR